MYTERQKVWECACEEESERDYCALCTRWILFVPLVHAERIPGIECLNSTAPQGCGEDLLCRTRKRLSSTQQEFHVRTPTTDTTVFFSFLFVSFLCFHLFPCSNHVCTRIHSSGSLHANVHAQRDTRKNKVYRAFVTNLNKTSLPILIILDLCIHPWL